MNRVFKVQRALLRVIDEYAAIIPDEDRDQPADWERIHSVSSAKIGMVLAKERGVDPIMAGVACACHDFGRIITGKQKDHAEGGYEPVKGFLRSLEWFNEEEIEQIATAVRNHSSKALVQAPLDEIVKDADLLDMYQLGSGPTRQEQEDRLVGLLGKALDDEYKW